MNDKKQVTYANEILTSMGYLVKIKLKKHAVS